MPSKVNVCQSCGMPLVKEENFGTENNKEKTTEYCIFCFQNGKFTNENLTMQEVIDKSIKMSMKLWMPEDKAREIAMNTIPNLKRWNN